MAATATKVPYSDASPAELREAILPEDVDQFDDSFRHALDTVAATLRLDALEAFLEHWRRIARSVNHRGHDHWRGVLAKAQRILAGERPETTVSMEEMDRRIAARLAEGR